MLNANYLAAKVRGAFPLAFSGRPMHAFAEALLQAAREAESDPDLLHEAPVTTPVRRLDEARAARHLKLRW